LAVEHILVDHGYLALVLLGFIEACCVPIPSEVTFGYAGVLAASGKLNLLAVIFLGAAAEIVGSLVAYSVGRFGGRPLVERVGRYVLITPRDLDRAERWFSGRGEFAVLLGRAMPVIRAFVSLAAGIADMPPAKFLVFGGLGTLAYAAALASIGDAVGTAWHRWAHGFSVAGYVLAALVVIGVVAFVAHRLSELRRGRSEAATSAPSRD
jgi:membrane protein DedA with SNARE-associated domain